MLISTENYWSLRAKSQSGPLQDYLAAATSPKELVKKGPVRNQPQNALDQVITPPALWHCWAQTACENEAWVSRDRERRVQPSLLQSRSRACTKPETFKSRQQGVCPEAALRSSDLHLSPVWPLAWDPQQEGSSKACHLGVMAMGWAELCWPCTTLWTSSWSCSVL